MLESTLNDDVDLLPLVTPASASTPAPTSAYLRQAKPSDIPALAAVYARAFARDPLMNWFGGVRALVPTDYDHDQYNRNDGNDNDKDNTRAAAARRTMKGLWDFQLMLVKMGLILGLVVVVVERCGDEREPGIKVGEGEKERIVGGAMWLRPGTSIDPSSFRRVRISPWRSLWSWGFRGFKRMGIDYSPRVEKIMDKEFAARGLKRLDSWHLLEIAVDPTCEGKGYCSLLVRDGLKRATGKPAHLEASTPRSRDIYAHLGFELNEERRFGVGSVDEMGIAAKGIAAVGCPIFIMTKWVNP